MGEVVDPIEELAHDHRELSGLLVAVHDALSRVERGQSTLDDELHEIHDGVEAFREALLEHFGREQEGLLPFVVTRLPAFRERADALVLEHDRIAEVLTVLVKELSALDQNDTPSESRRSLLRRWREQLIRFHDLYAAHTKSEIGFLDEVAASLVNDHDGTEQLRVLLDGI